MNNSERPCVFVNGVWKSGNHLVYSTLNELGIMGPFNGFASHLLFGRHKLIKRAIRGAADGIDVGLETRARVRPAYIRRTLRNLRGNIVGGHAAYSPEIMSILREEGAKVLCIRRDPRDILVSFADWIGSRPDYFMQPDFVSLSREQKVSRLLHGGSGKGYELRPFSEVLARAEGWLTAGDDALVVSFEDLVGPNGGGSKQRQFDTVAAICRHLDLPVRDEPELIDRIYGGSLTFNKGRSNRWLELQDLKLKEEINCILGPLLERWGYD